MGAMGKLHREAADRLKSCFAFEIARGPQDQAKVTPFRDPLGPVLATNLVDKLRAEGFDATHAKPGKACDAGFDIHLGDFSVVVILLVRPRAGRVACNLLTWCHKPLWRRISLQSAFDEWARVCGAIEEALRHDPHVISLLRLTWNESEADARANASPAALS